MLLVIDVDYKNDDSAMVAGIAFNDWTSADIEHQHLVKVSDVAPYEPGNFYRRELPCILALLDSLEYKPSTIIIDGYVTLGEEEKQGLGSHLYHALGAAIPVIGIAKNRFTGTPENTEVYRGTSKLPLFVTSKGIEQSVAKELVQNMHGKNRLPTLVKAVDRACRDGQQD